MTDYLHTDMREFRSGVRISLLILDVLLGYDIPAWLFCKSKELLLACT